MKIMVKIFEKKIKTSLQIYSNTSTITPCFYMIQSCWEKNLEFRNVQLRWFLKEVIKIRFLSGGRSSYSLQRSNYK